MRTWLLTPVFLFNLTTAKAADNPLYAKQVKAQQDKWAKFYTFVPEKFDYYFELGSMWEKQNQYWMGGGFGRHIGSCVFTDSQTCQQYWDIQGGAGGRDGLTTGLALTGLRWQFVNFPKTYSPSIRALVGIMNIRDDRRDLSAFTYALGYGLTTSVHKRVDFRIEARVGMADEVWTQTMFSFHLKLDKWVDYFGNKIKQISIKAFEATGEGLNNTGKAIQKVFGDDSNDKKNQ